MCIKIFIFPESYKNILSRNANLFMLEKTTYRDMLLVKKNGYEFIVIKDIVFRNVIYDKTLDYNT